MILQATLTNLESIYIDRQRLVNTFDYKLMAS